MSALPLSGRRIVVTRPLPQAERLAAAIRAAGGEAILLPAMEIRDPEDTAALRAIARRLEGFDWAIFVSPTAVAKAFALLRAVRGECPWPAQVRIAAIGRGSAQALREQGLALVVTPHGGADSEALLALPEFARPAGERIVIFRGRGGRALLGDTLAARGAQVEYAECYMRVRPERGVRTGEAATADAFTVSSGEGLANLYDLLDEPERERLRAAPLFVPHARVARQASALGARLVVTAGSGDSEMLAALVAYFGRNHADS